MVRKRSQTSLQLLGTKSSQVVPPVLDPSSKGTLNSGAVTLLPQGHLSVIKEHEELGCLEGNKPDSLIDRKSLPSNFCCSHPRSADSWQVDYLSHHLLDQGERFLHPRVSSLICQKLGTLNLDIIASRNNNPPTKLKMK